MLRILGANGLVICVWTDAPNMTEVHRMDRIGQTQARANGGKCALLNVIINGAPKFEDDVRARVREMTQNGKPFNWAVAHLILVEGLAGAGIRAFLTTSALFNRSSIPKRVFGNKRDASMWLAKTLGNDWTAQRVETMLEECLSMKEPPSSTQSSR